MPTAAQTRDVGLDVTLPKTEFSNKTEKSFLGSQGKSAQKPIKLPHETPNNQHNYTTLGCVCVGSLIVDVVGSVGSVGSVCSVVCSVVWLCSCC